MDINTQRSLRFLSLNQCNLLLGKSFDRSIIYIGERVDSLSKDPTKSFNFKSIKTSLGDEADVVILDALDKDLNTYFSLENLVISLSLVRFSGVFILLDFKNDINFFSKKWLQDPVKTFNSFNLILEILPFNLKKSLYNNFSFKNIKAPLNKNKKFNLDLAEQDLLFKRFIEFYKNYQNIAILGKRGRGKSFLSSRIISFLGSENCILLSSSKPSANSLKSLENLEFCTPTDIFKTKNTSKILFIEEASNISSSVILKLQNIFIKIIYISTVLGYEGTRDGFIKYILPRNSLILNPKKPLRWKEGDDLEVYSDLLSFREDIFINNSNILFSNPYNVDSNDGKSNILEIQDIEFLDVSYFKNTQNILSLYKLLLDAHYQNTLTDLMRLLDGKNILCGISYKNSLIGGLWAFDEGNIFDIKLQNEIFKGNRRPKGNLAVQMLYYFYGDRKLLSLSSLRISRIAVSKEFQSSGIGSLLISKLKSQAQNSYKDFISVSFSFVKSTYKFWLKNGFKLVYISKRISTVTARPQYIMIYPISVLAVKMLQNLEKSFLKDLDVDLCLCKIGDVNRVSYLDIKKFALFLRKNQSLDSALPSMLRILKFSYENSFISKVLFENSIKRLSLNSSKKDILQFINYNFKNLK